MKVLAWNIQQGGGKRAQEIVDLLERHAPDFVILSELRPSSKGLLEKLRGSGFHFQITGVDDNQVAAAGILSRTPILSLSKTKAAAMLPGRFLEAWSPAFNAVVAAIYGPLKHEAYDEFWSGVHTALVDRVDGDYLLGGDLNTGESLVDSPRDRFFCSDHFVALRTVGLTDLWRSRNADSKTFSYYSRRKNGIRGNGFRLDHLLASRGLASRLTDVGYDPQVIEQRISDHAPVFAEFSVRTA